MNLLVEATDLAVHYPLARRVADIAAGQPKRAVRAVDGVRLTHARGETLGIVGESGCGKSTLARALLGLTPITSGGVRIDGVALEGRDAAGRRALCRKAQMVFQDPHVSLNPRLTVRRTLREVLKVHRIVPRAGVDARIAELMERVGLSPDLADRRPGGLSGGQCQRVGIARALAVGPELIVADESVSALDVSIQAQILNLFLALQRSMGLSMIFISHDLSVVRHVCRRVAIMYLGRIVEEGAIEDVFRRPRHPYTAALIASMPSVRRASRRLEAAIQGEPPSPIDVPPGCAFHARCPEVMDVCRTGSAPGFRADGGVRVACHLYPASA